MPKENEYVRMGQDDEGQLTQIIREYEADPSRGLSHGVQKDAIQNGVGARLGNNEAKAFKSGWSFHFELRKVSGVDSLVFWDEGTAGLSGQILSYDEIAKLSAAGKMGETGADERLSRFLTRFVSGGNLGPGSFGRGKLIFQGASKDFSILIDSLRLSDNEYIALDRKIIDKQLVQPNRPFVGAKAVEWLAKVSKKQLDPLTKPGTRITILNVRNELKEAFLASFGKGNPTHAEDDDFHDMIAETWWEIIAMGAEIFLHHGKKTILVKPKSPLNSLVNATDKKDGFRVYVKNLVSVVVGGEEFKIKQLRLVVAPDPLPNALRGIYVQRKRMTIGLLSNQLRGHHKIDSRLYGHIILDSELERQFEAKEGTTHYGFTARGPRGAFAQVRDLVRTHLDYFQQELGLQVENTEGRAKKALQDALNDINSRAAELGLPTDVFAGPKIRGVELAVSRFDLPVEDTVRVELGDEIGPIEFTALSRLRRGIAATLTVVLEQPGQVARQISEEKLEIPAGGEVSVDVAGIVLEKGKYVSGAPLTIRGVLKEEGEAHVLASVSKKIWVGMEPPPRPIDSVSVQVFSPVFPRADSKRVELGEAITGIAFRLINNEPMGLKVNFDVVVSHGRGSDSSGRVIQSLSKQVELFLPKLSEKIISCEDLKISPELFGSVWDEEAIASKRRCEIVCTLVAAEHYEKLKKVKGEKLGPKRATPFYCGVEAEGASIFKTTLQEDVPEGHRSRVTGGAATGYTFILNVGHSSYKAVEGNEEYQQRYCKEQLLFQAYLISISNGQFQGPAEEFAAVLSGSELEPVEATRIIDKIVGGALNALA